VLAHELGHHINLDTAEGGSSTLPSELRADFFSGWMMRRLGAKLGDAPGERQVHPRNGRMPHPEGSPFPIPRGPMRDPLVRRSLMLKMPMPSPASRAVHPSGGPVLLELVSGLGGAWRAARPRAPRGSGGGPDATAVSVPIMNCVF